MNQSTFSEIQTITEDYVVNRGSAVDIYAVEHPVLWFGLGHANATFDDLIMTAKEINEGGEKIRVPVEYALSNKQDYGDDTPINQAKKRIYDSARFVWAGAASSATISHKDLVQNDGDQAMVSMVQGKLRSLPKSIRNQMAIRFYNGSGSSDQITGVNTNLFNVSTSTAYGEIKEVTVGKWKHNKETGAKVMSTGLMLDIEASAKVGASRSKKPNLYATITSLVNAFELSQHTARRYENKAMADAGFDNVAFHGVPIIADDILETELSSTDDVYGFNFNYLKFRTHRKFAFTDPQWVVVDERYPDTIVANTRWTGNLICEHRAAQTWFNNVSAS